MRPLLCSEWIDKPEHGVCYKKGFQMREKHVVCTRTPSSSSSLQRVFPSLFLWLIGNHREISKRNSIYYMNKGFCESRCSFEELPISVILSLFTLLDLESEGESVKILQVWRLI